MASSLSTSTVPAWQPLPSLLGVKSKKRLVFWLGNEGTEDRLGLSLTSRVALTGLAEGEVTTLMAACQAGEHQAADDWQLKLQPGLRVSCIGAGEALEPQLAAAAAAAPHMFVVEAAALRGERSLWPLLLGFQGALLVLDAQCSAATDEHALCALGVTTRWQRLGCGRLTSEPLMAWLHDIELDAEGGCAGASAVPGLEELLEEQLAPLYMEDFCAGLGNMGMAQQEYGLKLSLLVEPTSPASTPELLGFLAYKAWSAPRPGVSVAALAVPEKHRGRGLGRKIMAVADAAAVAVAGRVYLHALPTAVPFYVRLGYLAIEENGEAVAPTIVSLSEAAPDLYVDGEINEDSACIPMVSCDIDAPGPTRLSAEAWCPTISQHLEDGPTWMPRSQLLTA